MNERLEAVEQRLGMPVPAALRCVYDPGDGRFNDAGQWWVVWPLDQLAARNIEARKRGLPTTYIAFGDDGTGNAFCIEVGDISSTVLRWNWLDLAVERSEGSMGDFMAEWCGDGA